MAMPKKDNPYLKQVEQLLEDAKAKFKLIIEQAFTVGTSAEEAKKQADAVIEATMKAYQPIKKYLGSNSFLTRNVLKTNFNLMYKTTMIAFKSANAGNPDILGTLKDLQRINKERKLTSPPSSSDANTSYIIGSDGIEMSEAPSLKFLQTDAKYGYEQMMIDDYVDKVEKQMMKLAGATLVVPNNEGKHVSLRNKAEMAVRYQDTLDDLSELEDKGSKFVVISQHQDASMRCACWQGLIYERDTNGSDIDLKGWREWNSEQNTITPQPIGTLPDGQYYYSLRDAMEHGLFSYNCRHRLIEFKEGMKVPKQYEYNSQAAQQKREVDVNMRRMENNIRMLKEREQLALTPAERKKWINKSKIAQAKYKAYANRFNRVRNDWRTSIGRVERNTTDMNLPKPKNTNVVGNATINPIESEKQFILNMFENDKHKIVKVKFPTRAEMVKRLGNNKYAEDVLDALQLWTADNDDECSNRAINNALYNQFKQGIIPSNNQLDAIDKIEYGITEGGYVAPAGKILYRSGYDNLKKLMQDKRIIYKNGRYEIGSNDIYENPILLPTTNKLSSAMKYAKAKIEGDSPQVIFRIELTKPTQFVPCEGFTLKEGDYEHLLLRNQTYKFKNVDIVTKRFIIISVEI